MLKKKQVVTMVTMAVISFLIGTTFDINLLTTARDDDSDDGRPVWNTYVTGGQLNVTNFPLDEEGNLRTSSAHTSKVMLVFNESVTVSPEDLGNFIYLTSYNTSGYKYAYIMAKVQGSWHHENATMILIWAFDNNFGIQTLPVRAFNLYIEPVTTNPPHWGTGKSSKYEVHSTKTDLYMTVYHSDIDFDGLVTIVVFLTN